MTRTRLLDLSAMILSALCIIHCVLLPFMAAGLPLLGLLTESEWVHRVFVIMAIPISAYVFLKHQCNPQGLLPLRVLVSLGLICLTLGAFVEALHDYEVVLTVIGAIMVGTAHFLHNHRHTHT